MMDRLEKNLEIPRTDPEHADQGDLVSLKSEAGLLEDGNTIKYRLMAIFPTEDQQYIVWLGPPSFSHVDIELFVQELASGRPLSERFASGCKAVDGSDIKKVLDS